MPISDCGVGHDAAVRWRPIQCAIDDVGDIRGATIVVDVLRAFSFAACALSVGAPEVRRLGVKGSWVEIPPARPGGSDATGMGQEDEHIATTRTGSRTAE